jgi:ubiquinone/menaquinone biosynthesis C-methylase UbiE
MDQNGDLEDIKEANALGYRDEAASYDARSGHCTSTDVERVRSLLHLAEFANRAPLVVELGSGTGRGARAIRECLPAARIVASDISLEMLMAGPGGGDNVVDSCFVCDAERLPLGAETTDIVVCASLLHHLPDDDAVCRAAARVLRHSGVFMGIGEPRMRGCDFHARLRHIPRRYASREGAGLLLRRCLRGPSGWRDIFSYDTMSAAEFHRLDLQEIRGSILCRTPTKMHGGIDARVFRATAREYFDEVHVLPFGMIESIEDAFGMIVGRGSGLHRALTGTSPLARIARRIDRACAAVSTRLPFEGFCFVAWGRK